MSSIGHGVRRGMLGAVGYPRANMIAEWLMVGDATDTSGNGLNLTVSGASLTADRFGVANSAYDFTPPDLLTIANFTDPNVLTFFSWIKPDGTPAMDRVLSWREAGGEYLIMRILAGKVQVLWADGVDSELHTTDNVVITGGANQSVGFTLNGNDDPIIYINGLAKASTGVGSATRNLAPSPFALGGDASGNYFTGIIDDAVLWSVIKAPSEMLSIHNGSKP